MKQRSTYDDGALMYDPMARVVLAFTLTIRDFPLCAG